MGGIINCCRSKKVNDNMMNDELNIMNQNDGGFVLKDNDGKPKQLSKEDREKMR